MIKDFFNFLFNSIYRENCCVCGNKDAKNFLCKSCLKTVNFLSGFTHAKVQGIDVFSVCKYDNTLKILVQNYKFKNKLNIKYIFAGFLAEFYKKNFGDKKYLVVPVPSHKDRNKKRGYCHIEAVCGLFCAQTGLQKNYEILKKTKNTKPHYKLSKRERTKNVSGSFYVDVSKYRGGSILIIDDLITTGATLNEIIKEFKNNGIHDLTVLTLCKV